MKVLAWNLERKKPTAPRGAEGVDYLFAQQPDLMVLTEVRTTFPARHGSMLMGQASTPARYEEDERKIAIWSSTKLEHVTFDHDIDQTRFVAARADTPLGRLLVVAVCITWHMAEVTHHQGIKRRPWELHHHYLDQLGLIFRDIDEPFIVAGDFNQRYPRVRGGNIAAAEALAATFAELDIVTAGVPNGCVRPGIDHIALSPHLEAAAVGGWPHNVNGNRLSDHDGVWAEVQVAGDRHIG